jgi:hypothetical protein
VAVLYSNDRDVLTVVRRERDKGMKGRNWSIDEETREIIPLDFKQLFG